MKTILKVIEAITFLVLITGIILWPFKRRDISEYSITRT